MITPIVQSAPFGVPTPYPCNALGVQNCSTVPCPIPNSIRLLAVQPRYRAMITKISTSTDTHSSGKILRNLLVRNCLYDFDLPTESQIRSPLMAKKIGTPLKKYVALNSVWLIGTFKCVIV